MIRIGVVGCGRILNAHLQGYRQLREAGVDNFRITALCARKREDALMFRRKGEAPSSRSRMLDPSSADPLAASHICLEDFQPDVDVAIFTDYREMMASGKVDAVNDFTSLYMHHLVGQAALEAGKHLLVQKPLAISVKAGRRLVDLGREKKLTVGTFEVIRQSRDSRIAGWIVRQGIIGDLQMAIVGGIGGPWSPNKVVAETPWRHMKLLGGGGAAIDMGVHWMHLLRYVGGEIDAIQGTVRTFEPTRVLRSGHGRELNAIEVDVDDTYLATVHFTGGGVGLLLWSWGAHGEPTRIPGAPIYYGARGCLKGNEVTLDDGTRMSAHELFESQVDPVLRQRFFPLGLDDPFAIQQYDWLQAIQRGGQPETDGEGGLYDLAAAYAVIESSQLGATVTLDSVLNGEVGNYQAAIDKHYGI